MMRSSLSLLLMIVAGCELVVDFDRSRIVDGGDVDASVTDAGADASVTDAGADASVTDAGTDASVTDAATDGGFDGGDAATMDGGGDAGDVDAGVDAGGGGCSMDAECDDGEVCTADACEGDGSCTHTPVCAVSLPAPTLDDLSTVVTVPRVESPMGGFVVIHEDSAGAPGTTLGFAAVAAGVTTDVPVELDRPVADGETLHAMLHFDGGVLGTFEPGIDVAAMLMGSTVVDSGVATVPAGTPAAEVTVSGDGIDYVFASARPSTLPLPSGSDPTVMLLRGYRYRLVNLTAAPHPFEFVADGASVGVPADDVVQLSQAAAGALEGDADIAWSDDASISVFTVSASFEASVDAYRCSIHTASMRGPVTYADP